MSARLRLAVTLAAALLVGACASLPPMPPRSTTQALAEPAATPWGQRVAAEGAGVRLLVGGDEALATLLALADGAQRTLDLQYYAVLNETSSRVLLQRVRAAADRGVRVRLLIDDFNTAGSDDALLRLTRHPRIEVRLYNPLPSGRLSVVTKVIGSLHDVARINSRMHNKQLIADNALAVAGGRNLGDAYFLQGADANFVDLDLLVGGPVVRSLSAMFDRFWNSELAYPAPALIPAAAAPPDAAASAPELDTPSRLPPEVAPRVEAMARALAGGPLRLQRAPVRLLADAPSKSLAEGDPADAEIMFDDLAALLRRAQREVTLVSPYFVPGRAGLALLGELRARGVRVTVLTASLAGTDAPVVHVGYSRYRHALLDMGVELYELRPEFDGPRPYRRGGVHSRTNLHAKALIVDGRTVVIGSMNFDPRSARLNTEMGLVVSSPALAAEMQRLLDQTRRDGAWQVQRDGAGGLRWLARGADGTPIEATAEPDVSPLLLIGLHLLTPLAPEEML